MKLGPRRKIRWRRPGVVIRWDVWDEYWSGKTQREVGEELGVAPRTIRFWKSGKMVSPKWQREIRDVMGMGYREIFKEVGKDARE